MLDVKMSLEELQKASVKHLWLQATQMRSVEKGGVPIFEKADGCWLQDIKGKRYLDIMSYLSNMILGYNRQEIIEAIIQQMNKLVFACPVGVANEPAVKLAKKLTELTPTGLDKVYLTPSGSEANEVAMKMARQYYYNKRSRKFKIVSRWFSYQGATMGTISTTGDPRREKFGPLPTGFIHVFPPYCYRCPYEKTYPECKVFCARTVEDVIKLENADNVAAFIGDPITGWGTITPPNEYWPIIRKICDKHNIIMIIDEIITGFGRTGRMFACEHWGLIPDILVLGKGITAGYMPLSAVITKSSVAEAFLGEDHEGKEFNDIHTFGGTPPACAAVLATLEILEKEKLVERVHHFEKYLVERLMQLKERCRFIGDIRGKGLLWGIELVKDKESKKIFDSRKLKPLYYRNALEEGIFGLFLPMDPLGGCVIEIRPAFVYTEELIDTAINRVEKVINKTCQKLI